MNFAIIMPIALYLGLLVPSLTAPLYTRFVAPRGLWKLVPFRTRGWRSIFEHSKIYKIKWEWQNVDFNNFYIEEKK